MTARPRIVVNALPLDARGGGVSTYVRELLGALVGHVDGDLVAAVRPAGLEVLPKGIIPLVGPDSHGVRRALAGARGFGSCDLTHGLDVDLPVRRRSVRVATVHDLAVFDVPWAFPRHRALGEQRLVRTSLRRADAVIAVSAFTAERVRHHIGREAIVIHEAPSSEMAPPSVAEVQRVRSFYQLPERFVLHVGSIEPRKDLATLASACRTADVPLVLTGASLWSSNPPEGTHEIGYVPTSDLPALYGAATVVGYASTYEGFGLPPVEAMACGAAVVSTPVPAIKEVVGHGAATFAPGDVDGLAGLLAELVADDARRQRLAAAGQAAVAALSWDETARATAEVYRSLGLDV